MTRVHLRPPSVAWFAVGRQDTGSGCLVDEKMTFYCLYQRVGVRIRIFCNLCALYFSQETVITTQAIRIGVQTLGGGGHLTL